MRKAFASVLVIGWISCVFGFISETSENLFGADPDPYHSLFSLHIPKTAGASFNTDVYQHLPSICAERSGEPQVHTWQQSVGTQSGQVNPEDDRPPPGICHIDSSEGCFDAARRNRTIAMLRSPRAHVLSQFLHCKPWSAMQQQRSGGTMPKRFHDWVEAWAKLDRNGTQSAFCCYNPVNLQTRHFTCRRPPRVMTDFRYLDPGPGNGRVDVESAISNMESTWFIGITEAYVESLCLLHVKLRGELPAFCDCRRRADPEAEAAFPRVHHFHAATKRESVLDYRADTLALVDTLTEKDAKLYEAAKHRFYKEVGEVERSHHTRIVCDPEEHRLLETYADAPLRHEAGHHGGARFLFEKDPSLPSCDLR